MARNNWDDDDQDDFDGQESNLVKDLRKQLKELSKQNGELTEKVGTFEKQTRSSSVKDILASKQLNPKIAAFYPSDGEATPEAVEAWVKEYADVFGFQKPEEGEPDQGQTSLDNESVSSFQRMSASQSDAQQSARVLDLDAKIRAAKSPEELQAVLAQI